jgi:hypothetical protein
MDSLVKVALITAVPSTLAAVVSLLNRTKLDKVSNQVDGRLTELLEITRKSSHAEGVLQQKDEEHGPDSH